MAKSRSVDDGSGEPGPPVYGCMVKPLPRASMVRAAATAVEQFPGNRPNLRGISKYLDEDALAEVMHPLAIAVLTTKYWGPQGVKLGVTFMETTVPELRDKIIGHMNAWAEWANVLFAYSTAGDDVRISRDRGGFYSYLGPDIRHIPKNRPTMNLEGFVLKTPESEYRRVVRHETGHTLGCPHEHMRAEIIRRLDRAKTIARFKRDQGWSEQEVVEQVLTSLDEASLMGTPPDVDSIMCYQLAGDITVDGRPIPGGMDINASDGAFMAKIYPKAVIPTPPDPGPPTPSWVRSIRIDPTKKTVFFPDGWKGTVGV